MIQTTAEKVINVTPPAAIVDNGSYTTGEIDTQGWRFCKILAILGATDIAMVALKVQESDTSGSGFADVPGLVFGAVGAPALPSATDDNGIFAFHIDLRGRKRFLDVVATAGDGTAGTFLVILAILSRGEEDPNSPVERGYVAELAA